MNHPYKSAPRKSFWSRSVSEGFSAEALLGDGPPLIDAGEAVMSAGSCFAANIVPYLESAGIQYVWAERPHAAFAKYHREALSYHKFSAAYGNMYTARHWLQTLQRALGQFSPREDRWHEADAVIDPFRPGLAFPASDDVEFDALSRQHLDCVLTAIRQASVFVFTLGLTESWVSRLDGAVFPACPGTVRGQYNPDLHAFHNFEVDEIVKDLVSAFTLMRSLRPGLRFIITVSPVPLVATATNHHVVAATIYSKSVLRVAADIVTRQLSGVTYFPAYEIVTGPQAPKNFFEKDRREPSRIAIKTVMGVLLAGCNIQRADENSKPDASTTNVAKSDASDLSSAFADFECEEAASDA